MMTRSQLLAGLRLVAALDRRTEGQAVVELAICVPVLLILLTGIVAYGSALNNYVDLAESVGAGARAFASQRNQGGDPCAIAASVIANAAPTLKNTGNTSTGLGFTFVVGGQTFASATPSCSSAMLSRGSTVVATATYPCSIKLFLSTAFPNCVLTASNTESIQ